MTDESAGGKQAVIVKEISFAGVSILNPDSPEFSSAVAFLVDRTTSSAIQRVLLPFSYILKNTSNEFIIVYSTRWTLTDSAGKVTTQDCTRWNLSTLPGGDSIAPGASRLVSPPFRARANQMRRTSTKVEISLETIVFDDGTALGTDATNATAQAQAYLDAQRQVADDLASDTLTAPEETNEVPRTYKLSNPPQYEESLALYRRSLTSVLTRFMQSNSGDVLARLQHFQQAVEKKRNLNISRR